jgi:hypothetical protein
MPGKSEIGKSPVAFDCQNRREHIPRITEWVAETKDRIKWAGAKYTAISVWPGIHGLRKNERVFLRIQMEAK